MSISTNSDEVITAFKNLYSGYGKAHGKFEIKGPEPLTGKVQGKATTIHTGAPEQAWEDHLAGTCAGLGSIPLLDDGMSAQWAAIDIDVNDIDHTSLEKKVKNLRLPLIICRSKSGGAHCYLFLENPCRDFPEADKKRERPKNWKTPTGQLDQPPIFWGRRNRALLCLPRRTNLLKQVH